MELGAYVAQAAPLSILKLINCVKILSPHVEWVSMLVNQKHGHWLWMNLYDVVYLRHSKMRHSKNSPQWVHFIHLLCASTPVFIEHISLYES